jgi:NAD(P)H-dependent flavin oxidoreductase YrpB (nitropropane dioxygenase family)
MLAAREGKTLRAVTCGRPAEYAAARQAGDFETAAVTAGESASLIHDVLPACEIIERIVREASALVGWLSPQAA